MAAKRKSKSLLQWRKSLERKPPSRIPKPIVLVVCEGKKTEPIYFEALRRAKRMSREQIRIVGPEAGSHPKNVVEQAKFLKKEIEADGLIVDEVWCVFDRDVHKGIEAAIQQAKASLFKLAFSNPSFELWYLLHYQEQSSHIERKEVMHQLKSHIPSYNKSMNVYPLLVNHQDLATRRAQNLRKYHRENRDEETKNPSTSVDLLVAYLNSL